MSAWATPRVRGLAGWSSLRLRAAPAGLLLVLATASCACASGATQQPAAPDVGKVVFSLEAANLGDRGLTPGTGSLSELSRIEVMNTDGTGFSVLSAGSRSTSDADPVWSPDGRRIAFDRLDRAGKRHVYVMDADGSNVRAIMPSVEASEPRWSLAGDRLAFASFNGGLFVASDRGDGRRLASDASGSPEWSPDGRSLVYPGNLGSGDFALKVINVADGQSLTIYNDLVWAASWSPDGEKIAFSATDPNSDTTAEVLRVVDRDGTHLRTLAHDVISAILSHAAPQWSPDGKRLLYATDDDPSEIATVNVADGTVSRLTGGQSSSSYAPAWAAEGKQIVYVRERSSLEELGTDVWLMKADGTAERELTNAFDQDGGSNEAPEWSVGVSSAAPTPLPTLHKEVIVPSRRLQRLDSPLVSAAAIGSTVAFTTGYEEVRIWSADKGRQFSFANTGGADALSFAGSRLAWSNQGEVHGSAWTDIFVADLGRRRPFHVVHMDEPHYVGNLHASDSLVIYNSWTRGRAESEAITLWRVSGRRKTVIARGAYTAPPATAVDAGRIALIQSNRSVMLLGADGRRLDRFFVSTQSVRDALLRGSRLFLLARRTIDTYDIRRHRKLQTRPLQLGVSGYARLVGVRNGVLVYIAGIAIHIVRLSDGRDLTLNIPSQGGAAVAALTTRGLFAGYELTYSHEPDNILEFIPFSRLRLAFKKSE
jgi:Tol biopolymer transport system component